MNRISLSDQIKVITDIIIKYLGANRRLVIPQLGTLIVKEPGQAVVFSELLKRDDGVLRELLMSEGLSEVAAAGEIDRLVFQIRHAVQQGEEFRLDGLGTMRPGANSTISFAYDPRPAAAVAPVVESVGEQLPGAVQKLASESAPDPASGTAQESGSMSISESVPSRIYSADTEAPHVSLSPKVKPEDCLKGLRYGKPRKVGDGYAYVGSGRRKVDRFLVVAIIAAVVAVAAIIFGYVRSTRDQKAAETMEQLEIPSPSTPPQTPSEQ